MTLHTEPIEGELPDIPPVKAVIRNTDMTERMQQEAVIVAAEALERYETPWDIAAFIKLTFDRKFCRAWQCVVGQAFGRLVVNVNVLIKGELWRLERLRSVYRDFPSFT